MLKLTVKDSPTRGWGLLICRVRFWAKAGRLRTRRRKGRRDRGVGMAKWVSVEKKEYFKKVENLSLLTKEKARSFEASRFLYFTHLTGLRGSVSTPVRCKPML
jgi:hypothetical protein